MLVATLPAVHHLWEGDDSWALALGNPLHSLGEGTSLLQTQTGMGKAVGRTRLWFEE